MLKTRRSSTRNANYFANYFVSYVDDGQRASGFAYKKNAEALAAWISHPRFGAGRSTCVMQQRTGDAIPVKNTGICFVNGVRKARKRKTR